MRLAISINRVAPINIGSQASGAASELTADFNHLKKGQAPLKLDPAVFNPRIRQVAAQLASARATRQRNRTPVAQSFISPLPPDRSRRAGAGPSPEDAAAYRSAPAAGRPPALRAGARTRFYNSVGGNFSVAIFNAGRQRL